MTRIQETKKAEGFGTLSTLQEGSSKPDVVGESTDFANELQHFLGQSGKKSYTEKDVFTALVQQQIASIPGALERFQEYYDQMKALPRGQSERGAIFATNRAIKRLRVEGFITRDQAHEIRSRAFGAAQVDFNPFRLGDKMLGKADQKFNIEQIAPSAEARMAAYQNGTEVALRRPQRRRELQRYL